MAGDLDPEVVVFAHHMFELARNGYADELAGYLDAGLPPNLTNDKGDTLLILAAYHAHPDAVRVLIARGADTERVNDRGQTALGAAVFRKSTEIVSTLLAAGADPHAGSPSSIEISRFFELPEMLDHLLKPRERGDG